MAAQSRATLPASTRSGCFCFACASPSSTVLADATAYSVLRKVISTIRWKYPGGGGKQPPEFCTGSRNTAATVSGWVFQRHLEQERVRAEGMFTYDAMLMSKRENSRGRVAIS